MSSSENSADLAVIGSGIVGLAHAWAAVKRGLSVVVFERDEFAVGASVRNFGLVFTLGPARDTTQAWVLRSRALWLELADAVQFNAHPSGCMIVANRRDEWDVLIEFYQQTLNSETPYRLLEPRETLVRVPMLQNRALRGALWSRYELQVDPRAVVPAIARYLEVTHGVRFVRGTQVRGIDPPAIDTTRGRWQTDMAVVCPGHDYQTLYPELLADYGLRRCKLQMLRTAPQPAGWRLPCVLMSGLSLLRYPAFAQCPGLAELRRRLEVDKAETLRYGIHLIVSQSTSGELTIGDSHDYSLTPSPFNPQRIDELLLQHARALLNIRNIRVTERWSGVYAHSGEHDHLLLAPAPAVRVVLVTDGIGMSIAFALAEEVLTGLSGR
jgi:FAD dependent oxidoreductase TIGR03364